MKRKIILWLPFGLIVLLFAAFWLGLRKPDDHAIASHVVGKVLPEFSTSSAGDGQNGFSAADFRDGKPRLLNVFGSWCVPCLREMPMLLRLKQAGVEINGIAVHDSPPELKKFLAENGNPYARIGLDETGGAQLALGSAGVPETFVINGSGKVIYQHIGVIAETDIPRLLTMLGNKP